MLSINSATFFVHVPISIRSSIVKGSAANFRIVITGPLRVRGLIIIFTLEPSGNLASTYGDDSSTRLPILAYYLINDPH